LLFGTKCSRKFGFELPILAEEMFNRGNFRIKIGCAFFAQAKKVEQILRLSESNNIYIPLEYFRHNYSTTVNQNKRRTR